MREGNPLGRPSTRWLANPENKQNGEKIPRMLPAARHDSMAEVDMLKCGCITLVEYIHENTSTDNLTELYLVTE